MATRTRAPPRRRSVPRCRSTSRTSTARRCSRPSEERELAERVAEGDPMAREHMVKANLRLVVNIARGYLGKGLGLEDLIEEGNLGLMRAVEGFDGVDGDPVQHLRQLLDQAVDPPGRDEQRQADPPAGLHGEPALEVAAGDDRPDRPAGPAAHARGGRQGAAALEEEGRHRRQGDPREQPDPAPRGRRRRRHRCSTTC